MALEGGLKIQECVTKGFDKDKEEGKQKIRFVGTVEDSNPHYNYSSLIPNQPKTEAAVPCQYNTSANLYVSPSSQLITKNAKHFRSNSQNYAFYQDRKILTSLAHSSTSVSNDDQYEGLNCDLKSLRLRSDRNKPKAYLIEAHYASELQPSPRNWRAIAKVLDSQCNYSRENIGTISITRTRNNKDEPFAQFQSNIYPNNQEVEVQSTPGINELSENSTNKVSLENISASGNINKVNQNTKEDVKVSNSPYKDELFENSTSEILSINDSSSVKNKKSNHHSLKGACNEDTSAIETKQILDKNMSPRGRSHKVNTKPSQNIEVPRKPNISESFENPTSQILLQNTSVNGKNKKYNQHSLKKTVNEDPSVEETRKILEKKISVSGRGKKSREKKDKNVQFSKTAERLAGHRRRHYSLPLMNDNHPDKEETDEDNQDYDLTRKSTKVALDKIDHHRDRRDSLPPMHIDEYD